MLNSLRGFFEGNLDIDPTSWHAKLYRYWRGHARFKKTGYTENLCHYVRVLVFWAPLSYVCHGRVKKVPVWAPLSASFLGAFVWAGVTYFPEVLISIGEVLGALVVIGVLNTKRLEKMLKAATAPVRDLYKKNEGWIRRSLRWFFTSHVLYVVYPWSVLIALFVALTAVFDVNLLIAVAIKVGIVIGIVLAAVAFTAAIVWLENRKPKRSRVGAKRTQQPPRKKRVTGTVKLAGHYAMAKKRGICPFITFKSEVKQTS